MYQSVAVSFSGFVPSATFPARAVAAPSTRSQKRHRVPPRARAYLILTGATGTIGLVALSWDSDGEANSRDAEDKRNSTKKPQQNMVLL